MKYEKPMVIDLSVPARYAAGAKPLLCKPGAAADDPGEACVGGGAPDYTVCGLGAGDLSTDCGSGGAPGMNCLGGMGAIVGNCNAGPGGAGGDPDCNVGPSHL